jgi:hypothetical protein
MPHILILKGKKMKLTIEHLNSLIKDEKYYRFDGTTLMICALTLKNGFTQLGRSACIDEKEFNEQIGKELAKKDAISHLWALEGYRVLSEIKNK